MQQGYCTVGTGQKRCWKSRALVASPEMYRTAAVPCVCLRALNQWHATGMRTLVVGFEAFFGKYLRAYNRLIATDVGLPINPERVYCSIQHVAYLNGKRDKGINWSAGMIELVSSTIDNLS